MNNESEMLTELQKIRDAQERLLAEYQRVANESLAIQKQALETQKAAVAQQSTAVESQLRHARLYRIALGVVAVLIVACVYVLSRLWR